MTAIEAALVHDHGKQIIQLILHELAPMLTALAIINLCEVSLTTILLVYHELAHVEAFDGEMHRRVSLLINQMALESF